MSCDIYLLLCDIIYRVVTFIFCVVTFNFCVVTFILLLTLVGHRRGRVGGWEGGNKKQRNKIIRFFSCVSKYDRPHVLWLHNLLKRHFFFGQSRRALQMEILPKTIHCVLIKSKRE